MDILGYSIIENHELARYEEIERHAHWLIRADNNNSTDKVLKHLSKEAFAQLLSRK